MIEYVDSLDDFAGVLLEQKHKKLMFAGFQHVDKLLPFPAIEFARKTNVCYRVDH
jgi:hypothetical protein